ncbi:MAG: hypothetical protein RMK65_08525 [Anaerolineae bacterium]|nr:hypothetical protein [Anaerolineae bacterium]
MVVVGTTTTTSLTTVRCSMDFLRRERVGARAGLNGLMMKGSSG